MSNPTQVTNAAPPPIAAPYCDTYSVRINNHGVVTVWAGNAGSWHAAFSMAFSLAVDLQQKLAMFLADATKSQQQAQQKPSQIVQ